MNPSKQTSGYNFLLLCNNYYTYERWLAYPLEVYCCFDRRNYDETLRLKCNYQRQIQQVPFCLSARNNMYAFVEACYFENCNDTIRTETDAVVKLYNCKFVGKTYDS